MLASGRGTNLQAILDAIARGDLQARVALVVCDRREALARRRAEERAIPTLYLPLPNRRDPARRDAYGARLARVLSAFDVELAVLAGWMLVLPPSFLRCWPRVINLHPALLRPGPDDVVEFSDGTRHPLLTGTDAIRRAHAAGHRWTGVSVHWVTPDVDRGRLIAAEEVPIHPGEPLADLEARIHAVEHRLLPRAIQQVAEELRGKARATPGASERSGP